MKSLIVFCLFLGSVVSALSQSALTHFVQHPALKSASVGVIVKDMNTGRNVVSYHSQKALTPASTMKIVTTATALEVLGGDFRYKTVIGIDKNKPTRILIKGSGDPTLGTSVFNENSTQFLSNWASQCQSRCATKNIWEVYVADDAFGYDGISPEWTWIDMGNYYASGAYGISIFDNTLQVSLNTTDRKATPRIVRTFPEIKGLRFHNQLTTNLSGRDNGYFYGMPLSNERILRGNIPAGRTDFVLKGDIPDPGKVLATYFADALRLQGVNVQSEKTAREDYFSANPFQQPYYTMGDTLFTHLSRPLSDIIRVTNVDSNNHFAEHLIRTIGYAQDSTSTDALNGGIAFVQKYWKNKKISIDALTMADGSGLAPQDACTPDFLCNLLTYMYTQSSYSSVFYNSLPKAGQEGTLRNLLKGTKYQGKIRAKSGSIGGVQCFAGYLVDGKKKYAFTIMVNKFNGSRADVRSAIERFLLSL